MFTFRMSPAIL